MKLFTKNFLYTIGIIFLVTTMLLGILYITMPKYYLHTKEQDMTKKFNQIINKLDGESIASIQGELEKHQRSRDGLVISVQSEEEKVIYPVIEEDNSSIEIILTESLQPFKNKVLKGELLDSQKQKLIIYGSYSIQPVTEAREILIKLYPFLLVISLILGGTTAFFYSKFSTKRILKMMEKTSEMKHLQPGVACDISGKDEMTQLATNINTLYETHLRTITALKKEVEKVEAIEKSKSEFMRMASHELKTPLAGMMGIIEGMRYNVGKFKDHDTYLKICQDLLIEQSDLVQNILSISSLDNLDRLEQKIEEVSLSEIIESQLESYLLLSELGDFQMTKELSDDALILGNRIVIERVVSNLLSNACRYSLPNSTIHVELKDNIFTIKNKCSDLGLEDPVLLFEPFYRSDYSRNKKDGGSGLGLFIVKQIVDKNNWSIELTIPNKNIFMVTVDFNEKHE